MTPGQRSEEDQHSPKSNSEILRRLNQMRAADAPTHGGKLLSYVYDSGQQDLDELAQSAAVMALPVNGLDPTTFTSVAKMERDLIRFAKKIFNAAGPLQGVQGSITSGGTESCLLAVKSARDLWVSENTELAKTVTPKLVVPVTAHAAFQKAAHYFGLRLVTVPVSKDGVVAAPDLIAQLDQETALVVVSAPSYPTAQLDPIVAVARAAKQQNISCHVDACIGGFALAWWRNLPPWDFRVPGVTSLSADLHKYGYAPKGASILLQKGKKRHRKQFFATKKWPGYPVVNPTMLGSRSAVALAASWAIVQKLEDSGYRELTQKSAQATTEIVTAAKEIVGMRVMGDPRGPLLALCTDDNVPSSLQVDPHHFADQMRAHGFILQHQPGITQENGVHIPHSVHLTITPVSLKRLDELTKTMRLAADEVRGKPRAKAGFELRALQLLGLLKDGANLSQRQASLLLKTMGMSGSGSLPKAMAPLMRIIEELPANVAETILIEIIAQQNQ